MVEKKSTAAYDVSSDDEIAISVKGVQKDFLIPHEKTSTLKSGFTSFWRKHGSATRHRALTDISLAINKGEFFGIVGRNGSGKSTLLKIIAGIYQPTKGSVEVSGLLVPFIELGVGFNPKLTGRENVFLNGAILGFNREDIAANYEEIVEFAELEKFMDQKMKNYSSGMKVRLAFSVATILARTDILLVDEVLAVGDAAFQKKCFAYFDLLKEQGKTVVFVSHSMNSVRKYCDRAALIDNGLVQFVGDPEEAAQSYQRLFAETNTAKKKPVKRKMRWGDSDLKILQADVSVGESVVSVTATVQRKKAVKGAVSFGLRIADPQGRPIAGTNTVVERHKLPKLSVGESFDIVIELPNIFSNGSNRVDLALTSEDGATVHDWWNAAARFTIEKEKQSPYPTNLKPVIKTKKGIQK